MRISIAMAVKNGAAFLAEALGSVPPSLGRSGADYEILVADGGSSDSTLEIAAAASSVRIVSRADAGLYDGMTRAVSAATGDVLLLLNSDDLLLPGGLFRACEALARDSRKAFASGDASFGEDPKTARVRRNRGPMTAEGVIFGVPAINARVFRLSALRTIGPFRTDVGLGADRDLLLKLISAGFTGAPVAGPIYFYRNHAGSHTLAKTRAGAHRVYCANTQFAVDILGRADTTINDRALARASMAVEQLKLRMTGGRGSESGSEAAGLLDLARGMGLALKWRGVLSGT